MKISHFFIFLTSISMKFYFFLLKISLVYLKFSPSFSIYLVINPLLTSSTIFLLPSIKTLIFSITLLSHISIIIYHFTQLSFKFLLFHQSIILIALKPYVISFQLSQTQSQISYKQ